MLNGRKNTHTHNRTSSLLLTAPKRNYGHPGEISVSGHHRNTRAGKSGDFKRLAQALPLEMEKLRLKEAKGLREERRAPATARLGPAAARGAQRVCSSPRSRPLLLTSPAPRSFIHPLRAVHRSSRYFGPSAPPRASTHLLARLLRSGPSPGHKGRREGP